MFVPYNVDVPMERWPWANWVLIGFTTVMSIAGWANPEDFESWLLWSGDLFEWKQLFTNILLHADPLHLIGNMIFLFAFGNAVNARLGHVLFVLSYLVCGMVADGLWLATADGGALLGASGAIMGVIGMFLVYYPRNDVSVLWFLGLWGGGTFAISAYWLILAYFGLDLWGMARRGEGIAYAAHVGGTVGGFALATTFVLTGFIKPGAGEQTIYQAIAAGNKKPQPTPRRHGGTTPFRPPPDARGAPPARPGMAQGPPQPPSIKPPPGGWR